MSHDRGCPCGREKYEYDDCENPKCMQKATGPMAKQPTNINDDFDFGFSAVAEDDLEVSKQANDIGEKLQKMYDLVMPLLNNLAKNPDKEYIHWPNREAKIKEFQKKLRDLLNS